MLRIIIIIFLALFMGNGRNDQSVSASVPSPVQPNVLSLARHFAPKKVQPPELHRSIFNYAVMNGDCTSVPVYRRSSVFHRVSYDERIVEYYEVEEDNECDIRAQKNLFTTKNLVIRNNDSPRFDQTNKVYDL